MRAARSALIGLLFAASLAACSSLTEQGASSPMPCPAMACTTRSEGVAGLLRYAETIRVMDADAQQREYQEVEARFLKNHAATERFMLALLMSAPDSALRSDARARELLSEYVERNRDDTDHRRFAQFLLRGLNDRRAMEQVMEAERRQVLLLRKQVEELKAIEQHMDKREQVKEQRGSP